MAAVLTGSVPRPAIALTPTRSRPTVRAMASQGTTAFLGIDFGTSGARCCVIDADGATLSTSKAAYASDEPSARGAAWSDALFGLLDAIPADVKARVATIAIDGTSSTAMLLDADSGELLAPPKMYNESQAPEIVNLIKQIAPPDHTVTAASSTLAKVMAWHEGGALAAAAAAGRTPMILHQADWLASLLHGFRGVTDWNNALKLGFDPATEEFPDFVADQPFAHALPNAVCAPGTPLAPVTLGVSLRTGLPASTIVCAGTTDSIAAFLAADVSELGQAVTSLGSTMAIKLLSDKRVDDAAFGIYSHRLGDGWLVGGASNSGGVVLRQFFTDARLAELTPKMNPDVPTGLQYTVLPSKGERFPVNDPNLEPKLTPRPTDDAVFLQGMLEAMAATEAAAYRKLAELGATPVAEVVTAGGGAQNPVWTELRQRALGVPVRAAAEGEAAYGAAVLARRSHDLMRTQGAPLLM